MTQDARQPARKPSTANKILSLLQQRLRGLRAEDTLVVGLSGHGVQYSNPQQLRDGTQETQFFCPEDANLKDPNSLVPLNQLYAKIKNCKAGRKLLLVDACRNEVLSEVGKAAPEIELAPAGVTARTVPKGMIALYSCAEGEKSFEVPELQHGAFTWHVIKYLRGDAEKRNYFRGRIGVRGLMTYASVETRDFVFDRLSKDQYPESVGRTTDWSLGQLGPAPSITNGIGMQLRFIPAGEFMMGSGKSAEAIATLFDSTASFFADEHPRHRGENHQTILHGDPRSHCWRVPCICECSRLRHGGGIGRWWLRIRFKNRQIHQRQKVHVEKSGLRTNGSTPRGECQLE